MSRAYLVGYATFMHPENVEKYGYSDYVLVNINSHQRFLGVVNLARRRINKVFDKNGNLILKKIGVATVDKRYGQSYNAVLYVFYNGISHDVLAKIEKVEKRSHFFRTYLPDIHIRTFDEDNPLKFDNNPAYVYVAKSEIEYAGRKLKIVREDILPEQVYLERCRKAADVHGSNFRKEFEQTTFLADRVTPVNRLQS